MTFTISDKNSCEEFNANVLDLLKRKFPMTTRIALKYSQTAYPEKINFIITPITYKNHEHDFNVWEAFNMKDYHDLY